MCNWVNGIFLRVLITTVLTYVVKMFELSSFTCTFIRNYPYICGQHPLLLWSIRIKTMSLDFTVLGMWLLLEYEYVT